MSSDDLKNRKELQKLRDSSFFYEKASLSKAKKDIDEIVEKLDKELAKNKKIVEENNKKILETVSYEQFLKLIQLG